MDALTAAPTADAPLIQGHGVTEADWRASRWLQGLGALSLAALLTGRRRMVVVAPHPDDEVLGCGGLIHTARCAGIDVRLVSVTQGEACYPGTVADMADIRGREVRAAMRALGVAEDAITALGLADGAVTADEPRLCDVLASLIGPRDLVLGTWEEDGHPDHDATGRAARAAAALRGARYAAYPVWAWHWLPPPRAGGRLRGAARFHLEADARDAKRRAMACFESQLEAPPPHAPILPSAVVARFTRPFEVFLP